MKVRNLAATLALAISLPIALHSSAQAQEINDLAAGTDTQANINFAKDRLDKARVRLDIASKQVEAAKARLKAADAEFKAAKANHDARNLEHQAKKLSDASGLPEITEGQIERGRTKQIAAKETEPAKSEPATTGAPTPVDLSKTRLQQVDFNAQPEGEAPASAPAETPAAPAPDKQAIGEPLYHVAPPQVAATASPTVTEQPPIVP